MQDVIVLTECLVVAAIGIEWGSGAQGSAIEAGIALPQVTLDVHEAFVQCW
jgi:hypothetical protein